MRLTATFPFMHLFMKRMVYIIPSGEMHLLFNVMDG